MAKISMLGRDFDIPRYKLGAMIAAAPFIDSQKARETAIVAREAAIVRSGGTITKAGETRTMVELYAGITDTLAVIHVGIVRIDPAVTLDDLIDDVDNSTEAYGGLVKVMAQLLGQSGMTTSGEAPAPSAQAEPEEASLTNSAPSSSSLSQPE